MLRGATTTAQARARPATMVLASRPAGAGRTALAPARPPPSRRAAARPIAPPPPAASAAAASPAPSSSSGASSPAHRAVAAVATAWASWKAKVVKRLYSPTPEEVQALNAAIHTNWRNARRLAVVAPFASMSGGGGDIQILALLIRSITSFVRLYLLFLFVRVLLSWFPAFNWERQPWMALRQVTDPYLNVFRGFVPSLFGQIDFTPLFGFLVLQTVEGYLTWLAFTDEEMAQGYPVDDEK